VARWKSAVALASFGAVLCLGLDLYYSRYSALGRQSAGGFTPLADLVESIPFVVLAITVAFLRPSRPAVAAATVVLTLLTYAGYDGAWTGTTSTSPLSLLLPWMYGIPAVLVIALLDRAGARGGWRDRPRRPDDVDYELERHWAWPFR
jgi:hypothetical protein